MQAFLAKELFHVSAGVRPVLKPLLTFGGAGVVAFLTKEFVVPLDERVEFFRNWFSIDRNHGSVGFQFGNFLIDPLLQRLHLTKQLRFYKIPLRHLTMAFEFRSHRSCAVANLSHTISKFRIFQHLFDVSQLIGPFTEIVASERTRRIQGVAAAIALTTAAHQR